MGKLGTKSALVKETRKRTNIFWRENALQAQKARTGYTGEAELSFVYSLVISCFIASLAQNS